MKASLNFCFVLFCSMAFSQSDLFVSNGSYIYVDGTDFTPGPNVAPLYVTNDINLESNSHIYLRNDAQLLQGNNVGNSGQGELSVYQEGNVNQWSYNYWCSPVGGVLTDNNSNNPFRVNQIDDPLLTTPLSTDSNDSGFTSAFEGTADPLVISNRWLFSFVTSDQYSEWIFIGDDTDLDVGLGFTMKGHGTGLTGNTTYDFRGKPNNGEISNLVAEGQWTLIGNPYPSALDARDFLWDPDNLASITGTLFYWEQDGNIASHVLQDYQGGYHEFTINSDGTLPTLAPAVFFTYDEQDNSEPVNTPPLPPAFGSKIARRYIPIGQGFMVEGETGTTGTVFVRNSHREFIKEDGTNSSFFRGVHQNTVTPKNTETQNDDIQYQDNGLSIVPDDYRRFRLNVDFQDEDIFFTRQLVLNFHDSATMEFDYGLELRRSERSNSDVYFSIGEDIFSAQAYPFDEDLRIPLVVDIEDQQPLRFRIFDIQNFEGSQGIYIYDALNDTHTNLRENYYELNVDAGHYPNRFEIVFTSENLLSTNEEALEHIAIRQNNSTHQLQVFNPTGLDISSIELYDVSGRRIINSMMHVIEKQYNISTKDLRDGVYIVSVTTETTAFTSAKVIVKN